jgi:glutamate-ammonia-ligase adenylyltransferase
MEALRIISDEHQALASILHAIRFMLKEVGAGRLAPDLKLFQAMVHYLDAYAEQRHHPREDPLFIRLAERSPEAADALARAYVFLRRVEHRIQYLDDQQTHILPTDDADLDWIARTLGYDSACPFLCELDTHREFVAQEFDRLLGGDAPCKGCGKGKGSGGERHEPPEIEAVLTQFPERVQERLQEWTDHPRVLALRDEARGRLMRLLQRTAQWLEEGRVSEDGVLRMADWVEPLLRRESYIALLLERPAVHERLLRVLGAARWPARYVMQHPGVIDELASPSLLDDRFDAAAFEQEMEWRHQALAATGEDDEENLLNLLRRGHHAEVFRTLVRDVEGRISVEQVADDLSALADCILRVTMRWCWPRLRQKHREEPRFGVIGYGKLGGKELGYGSDLDVVFVFDDEHEDAQEAYAAFVRKLITWLTVKTGEGDLFEIDTALRPNGNSGLLVTNFESYADYQENRGSNTAWTWEHQAMTRARMVPTSLSLPDAATDELVARFDAVRHAVITAPRDQAALRGEIVAMREKMRAAHPVKQGLFDVKHSPGGMVDAEFVTQYLVLAHSGDHPGLQPNLGNISLLRRAEEAGLLPEGVGQRAADAYRALRRVQHRARLDEQPTQVAPDTLAGERAAIQRLWQVVFE